MCDRHRRSAFQLSFSFAFLLLKFSVSADLRRRGVELFSDRAREREKETEKEQSTVPDTVNDLSPPSALYINKNTFSPPHRRFFAVCIIYIIRRSAHCREISTAETAARTIKYF